MEQRQQLNFAAQYPKAIHAVYQGQQVRVCGVGDIEGNSPSLQIVNGRGRLSWVPQDQVTITDPDFLPLGQETANAVATALSGNGSSGSSGQGRQPVGASR